MTEKANKNDGMSNQDEDAIYETTISCLGLFNSLNKKADSSATLSQGKSSERLMRNATFLEDMARNFNIWIKDTGALADLSRCLDFRLKGHNDIKSMVLELLQMLERNLEHDIRDSDHKLGEEATESIRQALDELHFMANAIRKSIVRSQNFTLSSTFGKDDDPSFENSAFLIVRHTFPYARRSLCKQISISLAVRRKRLLRQMQQENKLGARWQPSSDIIFEMEPPRDPVTPFQPMLPQPETPLVHLYEPQEKIRDSRTRSVDTRSYLDTGMARHHIAKGPALSRASVESSMFLSSREYPPKPDFPVGARDCRCPYCARRLSIAQLKNHPTFWDDHLDEDLQPYTCLSEACTAPLLFFITMKQWVEHMNSMHSKQWNRKIHMSTWFCDIGHEETHRFDDLDGFIEHMKAPENHPDRQPPSDLQIDSLSRTKQQILEREDEYLCSLCNYIPDELKPIILTSDPETVLYELHKHIASHIKDLAPLSIPRTAVTEVQNMLKPSFVVPFERDRAFVGRKDILRELWKNFEQEALQSHHRAALVGLGGVGKSHVAIEYAYRVSESVPQTWIFWVHASNAARFELAYRDIAAKVELPGRDNPETDILLLVYNWLSDEKNGRWFMILDEVDDNYAFLSLSAGLGDITQASKAPHQAMSFASFLPQSPNGWIVVTSRNQQTATDLVGKSENVIWVMPMPEKDALALMNTRVSVSEYSEGDASALVQAIECVPLAVTHAAAYIAVQDQKFGVSAYLDLLRDSKDNKTYLPNILGEREMGQGGIDSYSAVITWQISFENIRMMKPEAAGLLSLMAMFDRQGIPESILYDSQGKLQFEDAVAPLISFSLVRIQSANQLEQQGREHLFEMHGLVQFAMRKWLEEHGEIGRWQKASLRIMAGAFPNKQHEKWASCRLLLPHSKKLLSYVEEDPEAMLNQASVATNTGWYLLHMGEYEEAEAMFRQSLEGRERILGLEHPDTLTSLKNLASVLQYQEKYEAAEEMHRRALEWGAKVLGSYHADTLASMDNLMSVLWDQGKYKEAEEMSQQALEGREKVLGKDHPDTMKNMNNLAVVLQHQGKHEAAEKMYRQALEGREKVLGKDHLDTLVGMVNLAAVLQYQGKYEIIEEMSRQALEGFEKALGKDHPNTLTIMNNLTGVLQHQGKYEAAEEMSRQTLEGRKKVLGKDHPNTLTSMSNLAAVLENQGKYEAAEEMDWQALEGREKALGRDHPDTLASMDNLAAMLQRQGKYKEGEEMNRQALEGRKKVLGKDHPDTLNNMNNLAIVLQHHRKYKEAEEMTRQALEGSRKVLGNDHPNTLTIMKNLVGMLQHQKKYKAAREIKKQALKGRGKVLGKDHPDTLASVDNLATVLQHEGGYEAAEEMSQELLEEGD